MATEDVDLVCARHPRSSTLIRCCNCDTPICVKCMNETPVGMKCPDCARVEFRKSGGRRQYAAGAVGLLTAAVIGYGVFSAFGRVSFLVAIALGAATGFVVRKVGARRRGLGGTAALAAICGLALAALALGAVPGFLASPMFLVPGGVAAAAAAFLATR
ncbi:MAG TPA: hypothetical protein VFV09_11310 [Actinomycetota bacterium]|jgi:hypothetical protein|nr:hypothetical protein [Actinomycetota bacterium]